MTKLATQCIERQISALTNLHAVVETPEYARILERVIMVAQSQYTRRVMIAGVGKNSNIASKISETMASLGIPSFYLNVSHCGHGDFGFIGPYDIIIHISRSGTTREMLEAMKHIRTIRPNVYQALIHCKADKPTNPFAHDELFIGTVVEGDEFGLAPTTSTTALLCVLDTISVQASHAIKFERLDFLKFHPDGALGDMLKSEQALSMSPAPTQAAPPPVSTQYIQQEVAKQMAPLYKAFDEAQASAPLKPSVSPVKDITAAVEGLSAEDAAAIAGLMDPSIAKAAHLISGKIS